MNEIYRGQDCYPYEGGIMPIDPPEPDMTRQNTQRTSNVIAKLNNTDLETRTQEE